MMCYDRSMLLDKETGAASSSPRVVAPLLLVLAAAVFALFSATAPCAWDADQAELPAVELLD